MHSVFFHLLRIRSETSKIIPRESESTLLHLVMIHESLWQGIGPKNHGRQTFQIIPLLWGHALGVVYTMDHEIVPRPCKICDWWLNSSHDLFSLHQGQNVKVTMNFEVPKRHILRSTLSTGMVKRILWWERQKRCSSRKMRGLMVEKCCYNKFSMIFFYNYFWRGGGD